MHSPLQPCPERILARLDAAPKRTLISTQINKPENDDTSIPDPIEVKKQSRRSTSTLATARGQSGMNSQPALHLRPRPRCRRGCRGLTVDRSVLQLHFSVHATRRGRQLQHRWVLTCT